MATIPVDLTNRNDATVSGTLSPSSPSCNGQPGKKCLCGVCSGNSSLGCKSDTECATAGAGTCTGTAGEPRKVSACVDNTATPVDGTVCSQTGGNAGECADGPVDQHCLIETFRGCINPGDCPAPGDSCGASPRPCFPGYDGNVGDSINAIGAFTTPHNHTGASTFASIFCVAPTSSSAVNSAAGLPGPGRLQLTGISTEDGTSGACLTKADFLPTSKGGALDTGWTGLAHNAKVVSGGKVTVGVTSCTGSPGSCHCSYTGPIANP